MSTFSMVVLWFAFFILLTVCRGSVNALKPRLRHEQYDALLVTRCKARCWSSSEKGSCMKGCLLKGGNKIGICPSKNIISPFASACLEECYNDFQCPSISKCCRHSCGITCQQPEALLEAIGVPDIPSDVKIERRKKRNFYIEWKPGGKSTATDIILYHIEERHHAGRNFIEKRLTDWTLCSRTFHTNQLLKNFAKPGRWYQFRLAAVNENGTKGFSDHVLIFSTNPKPPKAPKNITVSKFQLKDGKLNVNLSWTPPISDWPINKYKVFWSRRLQGATALDSVLVNQRIISKDQTTFLLESLYPNSLYFLQVQAFAQFGKDRLKGDKSGFVLNTTIFNNSYYLHK